MQSATRTKLYTIIAALLLSAGASCANAASNDEMAPADKQLNQLYWQGQEALKNAD